MVNFKKLKKYLAILFAFTYLISMTELNQLLKFPLLIQHFAKHKIENPQLSVFGFLAIHYFNGNPHDEDYDQDMRLPFKSDNTCINILGLSTPSQYGSELKIILYPKEIKLNFPSETIYSSSFLQNIWQPPKNS
ncbi:MAG: hypothetical protein IE931_00930 [Sphingobacteriales bacterium]|nr:hypothetical protein [Sphingobacteriales bacterium]